VNHFAERSIMKQAHFAERSHHQCPLRFVSSVPKGISLTSILMICSLCSFCDVSCLVNSLDSPSSSHTSLLAVLAVLSSYYYLGVSHNLRDLNIPISNFRFFPFPYLIVLHLILKYNLIIVYELCWSFDCTQICAQVWW